MFDLLVSPFFDSQGGQIKVRFGGTLRVRPTAMKRLQEQKAKLQQRIQQQDKQPLSKKECREMRDLLEVNIALLEVLEESDPDELKKKEYRQQRKRLQARLAYVRRVVS